MLPKGSSLVRSAAITTAALVLGLGVARSIRAQTAAQLPAAEGYREAGPKSPEMAEALAGARQPGTRTAGSASNPVLTPGYFEVVCPAICYGGAFHVCNIKAFAGPGYYGPFRRYWAYSTYGPSFNIGPDDSLQYGLIGGVMCVAMRSGHGKCKHGTNPCPYAGFVPLIAGMNNGVPIPLFGGASSQPPGSSPQQPAEKLPSPTGNTAYLRLLVPANAEVLVEGRKTTTTGTVREFVSPPLDPGKNMIYSVLVRYTDASGKTIEETHSLRVHANDRLDIDCTKPANVEQPRTTALRP
jgi:uncharacterized protein (TIGR03000 family)